MNALIPIILKINENTINSLFSGNNVNHLIISPMAINIKPNATIKLLKTLALRYINSVSMLPYKRK